MGEACDNQGGQSKGTVAFGCCGWDNDMESLLTGLQTNVSSHHERNEGNSPETEARNTIEHPEALFEPAIQGLDKVTRFQKNNDTVEKLA